jgi:predicted Zn-dependent protease
MEPDSWMKQLELSNMNGILKPLQGGFPRRWLLLVLLIICGMNGCVTDPVTGEKKLSFLSREDEIALGQQGDQEIVAEYGVYDDAAIAAHVSDIGKQVAAVSDDPSYPYTFRVLNTPVINAFALPGGYVYVTRGLLAYLQNDAQLAMVLGHEVGHVTAHHSARQYTNEQLVNLGIGIGGAVFEDVRPFLGAISTGFQLLFLKYSRDDEREADELGVRYATKAGYQASEGAKFFDVLVRMEGQQPEGAVPDWQSTHPDPGERESTIISRAAYWQQQYGGQLGGINPTEYIPRLQNLVFGDDPRQGFIQNGIFYQPQLAFQFQVPSGWQVANLASQVQMAPQAGDAAIILTTVSGTSPSAAANQFVTDNKAQVLESSATSVNGFSAYRVRSNITVDDGQGGTQTLTALSYFIAKDNLVYVFHGYSDQSRFSAYASTFEGVFTSFAQVTNSAVLNVAPFRVQVFQASRTDQFQSLVQANSEAGLSIVDLSIMNQVQPGDQIPAGTYLKQVQ